jgi:magnesium-transporting ATPase (P-type)
MMEDPPRNRKDKILNKESITGILFNGSVMGLAAYGAFLATYYYNFHAAHHYEKSMTITFVSIIFGQYANLLSRRTYGPIWGKYLFSNKYLLFAFALSFSLLLLIIYVPLFNLYFHTSALRPAEWLFPLTAGMLCVIIYEYRKKRIPNDGESFL